jgi:hypothetical protein
VNNEYTGPLIPTFLCKTSDKLVLNRRFQKSMEKVRESDIIILCKPFKMVFVKETYGEHGGLKTPGVQVLRQFLPRADIIRKVIYDACSQQRDV